MRTRGILGTWLAGLLLMGCDGNRITAPPEGCEHAAAADLCFPADAEGVVILLSGQPIETPDAPRPRVTIVVERPLNAISGRTWRVTGDNAQARASISYVGDIFQGASAGSVWIARVTADSTVEGRVDVSFSSPFETRILGTFTAPWIERTCG